MKKLLLVFSLTILLSGCTPEKIFSLLAQSDVEQAAGEQVKNTDQTILDFQSQMEQKSEEFEKSTDLSSVIDDGSYGKAFLNTTSGVDHEVWAILPPLEEEGSFYEGWLVDPTTKKFISTGAMKVSEDGLSRFLSFSSPIDYSSYTLVVITKELIADDTPEVHIIEGVFTQK